MLSKEKIHFHSVDKVILLPDVQHAGAGDYSVKMRRHKEDMTNQFTIILIERYCFNFKFQKNYLSDMRTSPCLLDGTFMRNILLLITGLSLMILSALNRVYNIGDTVPDIYTPVRTSEFNISSRCFTN